VLLQQRSMEKIELQGSEDTPSVILDKTRGIFKIGGRSLPEDVNKFYGPVVRWIDEYTQSPNAETKLEVRFEYFNTASAKLLLDLFGKFDEMAASKGIKVEIDWFYDKDDEDMKEAGEEYADFLSIPFRILQAS
jgi:hypothetical protein